MIALCRARPFYRSPMHHQTCFPFCQDVHVQSSGQRHGAYPSRFRMRRYPCRFSATVSRIRLIRLHSHHRVCHLHLRKSACCEARLLDCLDDIFPDNEHGLPSVDPEYLLIAYQCLIQHEINLFAVIPVHPARSVPNLRKGRRLPPVNAVHNIESVACVIAFDLLHAAPVVAYPDGKILHFAGSGLFDEFLQARRMDGNWMIRQDEILSYAVFTAQYIVALAPNVNRRAGKENPGIEASHLEMSD